jgi:uncharacterized protein YecT (DUF1311 family)
MGRYQVVFYKDAVLVFDLEDRTRQPLEPSYVFTWIAPTSPKPPVVREAFTPLPCPKRPQTTLALEGCAESAILRTDRAINAQAKVIVSVLSSRNAREMFVSGEESWLNYRGTSCVAQTSRYAGGSGQPVVYGLCVASRNRTHLAELAALRNTIAQH